MVSILILTSLKKRHKFFVNSLVKEFNVLGVISEEKRPNQKGDNQEEDEIIKKHFKEREEAELKYFGKHIDFNLPEDKILRIENGKTNDQDIFEWVKEKNPEYLVLFGTSIIKPPLLSFYENRIINMHLGLSPYYRGSGTNFWPLVNNEPECVGATIHLAILKVDAGSILGQARPKIDPIDHCHDLGCKTIIAGTEKMIDCIKKYRLNLIAPKEQDLRIGQVYKRKDFNSKAVSKMRENLKGGMMQKYLNNKLERDTKFPIIK